MNGIFYPAIVTDTPEGFEVVDNEGNTWAKCTSITYPVQEQIEKYRETFKQGTSYRVEQHGEGVKRHYTVKPIGIADALAREVAEVLSGATVASEKPQLVRMSINRKAIAEKATEASELFRHHAAPETKTLVLNLSSPMPPEAAAATLQIMAARSIAKINASCTVVSAQLFETIAPSGQDFPPGTRHYVGYIVLTP